jgi:hypothetical protein
MEKSPKSPKKQVATYIISAHGTMLTSILGSPQTKKYFAITIPENVELYTHDTLGKCIPMYKTETDLICKNYKEHLQSSHSPAFKFSHEHGEVNKFPELFFTPDGNTPSHFYTGITHCIPEALRTTSSRKKEIIYNIDAKNTKDCACSSIVSNSIDLPYDCEKKYSNYYKEQLRDYKYDPNSNTSKCGPILMSEAVKVIKAHCDRYYEPNCVIKIYIFSCLGETDLKTLIDGYKRSYNYAKQVATPYYKPTQDALTRYTALVCSSLNSSPSCISERSPTYNPEPTSVRLVTPDTIIPPNSARLVSLDTALPPNSVRLVPLDTVLRRSIKQINPITNKEQIITRLNDLTSQPRILPKTLREILTETPTFEPSTETLIFEPPTTYLQSKVNLRDFYYEVSEPKNNALTKVVLTNYVENLSDFKALPLIKSHLSKHRFGIESKIFEFITYKDAFMEFTSEQHAKLDGPRHKRLELLQKKHRALSRKDLGFYLLNALIKIKAEKSGDDIAILPEINTINFVRPFTKNVTDSELVDNELTNRVYNELKKLIAQEKAKKLGQGRRVKKTLRKKYKKPKKTKHIRRFTHKVKSKKHTKK